MLLSFLNKILVLGSSFVVALEYFEMEMYVGTVATVASQVSPKL